MKCQHGNLIYLSYPPQNKCKNCGRFWFCKDEAPECTAISTKNEELCREFIEWHDEEHGKTGYWPSNYQIADWWLAKISQAYEQGKRVEHKAWLARERCTTCGNPMEPSPTSETCGGCWEDN